MYDADFNFAFLASSQHTLNPRRWRPAFHPSIGADFSRFPFVRLLFP